MRTLWSVVLFMGTWSIVSAADVAVKVSETPVPAYSFAEVTVPLEKGDQVAFQVFPNPKKKSQVGNKLFLSGPPGAKYTVMVTIVNFGDGEGTAKRFDTGQAEVTMDGEQPDVDPVPEPDVNAVTLTNLLKSAFKQEDPTEKLFVGTFAALYAKYASDAELSKYKTWGDLDAAMRKDVKDAQASGKLVKTQTVVAEYLGKHVPFRETGWENVVIEVAAKKKAEVAFTTVSNALGKLK